MPRERDPAKRLERNQLVAKEYRDGVPVSEIAARYRISGMVVCEIARKAGFPKRRINYRPRPKARARAIASLYAV